jgi:hypothetical protein
MLHADRARGEYVLRTDDADLEFPSTTAGVVYVADRVEFFSADTSFTSVVNRFLHNAPFKLQQADVDVVQSAVQRGYTVAMVPVVLSEDREPFDSRREMYTAYDRALLLRATHATAHFMQRILVLCVCLRRPRLSTEVYAMILRDYILRVW